MLFAPLSRAVAAFGLSLVLASGWSIAHPGHDADDTEAPVGHAASTTAAKPSVSIEARGGYRYITSNGIPDHAPGRFPNRNNPNAIAPQRYAFRVPLEPKAGDAPREAPRGTLFGVAVNGIVFDPGTAEFWRDDPSLGWRMEAIGGPRNLGLDASNAHVQPSGAYHYHGVPKPLLNSRAKAAGGAGKTAAKAPTLIGWAADGFPIYGPLGHADTNDAASPLKPLRPSYQLRPGARPPQPDAPGGNHDGAYTRDWQYVAGVGDLDECNGRFGVTPEFPHGTYYYVITEQFPFIPRYFRGTPDDSFNLRRPPPPGRRGGGAPAPRT